MAVWLPLQTFLFLFLSLGAVIFGGAGCDVFSTRSPETPTAESGTYIQPDTPEQVIANVQAAIAELNTLNYRRSLQDELVFTPAATAEAQTPVLLNWTLAEEERYFNTMVAAAQLSSGHRLELNDRTLTLLSETRYVLDATYVLTVNHSRVDAPTSVQGRVQWLFVQGEDGLWTLAEWTDQELDATTDSWSTLKAAFAK